MNASLYLPVITFIIGTVIGSGAIWKWLKHKIDKITATTELRGKRSALLEQIISLTNDFIIARDLYNKANSADTSIRMKQLKTRLDVLKLDFYALENKLSSLENRAPDKIQIEFIVPPPPVNLRII